MRVFCYRSSGKTITKLNQSAIDEVYDLAEEIEVKKNIAFIANQFIHSCTVFAYREEDRNWGGVYACSDWERNRLLYRIPISEIIKVFEVVGNDYPAKMSMIWDKDKNDYRVNTN